MEPYGKQKATFGTKSLLVATIAVFGSLFLGYNLFFREASSGNTKAVVILRGDSSVSGTVTFEQPTSGGRVKVSGKLTGFPPNSLHGFHVHQLGDLTGGCASAGPHFDVYGKTHGAPTAAERHVGDLGNILADASGEVEFVITDKIISLNGLTSIVGRSVVVHAGEDDLGLGGDDESRKTGNAGARAACGVIGLA